MKIPGGGTGISLPRGVSQLYFCTVSAILVDSIEAVTALQCLSGALISHYSNFLAHYSCLELKTFLWKCDILSKLILVCIWVNYWHYFLVIFLGTEICVDNIICLFVNFIIVMALKEFDFVKT